MIEFSESRPDEGVAKIVSKNLLCHRERRDSEKKSLKSLWSLWLTNLISQSLLTKMREERVKPYATE